MVSIKFNGDDLSTHGLEIHTLILPFSRERKSVQLRNKEFSVGSVTPGKTIIAGCRVFGDDLSDLLTNMDNINEILNVKGEKKLEFGHLTDRYWMAEFENISGPFTGIGAYEVELTFFAPDPYAYSITEQIVPKTINLSPFSFEINVNGSAPTTPLYYLTPNVGGLNPGTLYIWNKTTDEKILIEHNWFTSSKTLLIDTQRWIVEFNGDPVMESIEGEFPFLVQGKNNIEIAGAGTNTDLKIKYRERFV